MSMQASESAGVTAMADALVAAGHLSQADATRLLAQDSGAGNTASAASPTASRAPGAAAPTSGAPATAIVPAPASATPAPPPAAASAGADAATPPLAEIEIDPLFAPPASSAGYRLEMDPAVPTDAVDLAAIKSWFHTARLPEPIAQSLYREVERMQRRPPDAAALARMTTQTRAELARHWGGETDAMLAHARRLIDEVAQTHPYIKTALARGPGSNPVVVRQLAEHAARLYGRNSQGEQ